MTEKEKNIIDTIRASKDITKEQLKVLLETEDTQTEEYVRKTAQETARRIYGNQIFIRGLIEFTNYCKNDCYYCGIRRSNQKADRYRLTKEEILDCCKAGYALGFRTFVLQGGEDPFFTDEKICRTGIFDKRAISGLCSYLVHRRKEPGKLSALLRCRSGSLSAPP